MRVLVVGQVQVGHGERRQFEGSKGVAAVLHVAGDGEELRVGHARGGGVDDYLVSRLEGDVVLLAEGEGGQGAVLGVLHSALQGQGACAAGQLLPLRVVEAQAQDGVVGHHCGCHYAGRFGGGEESVPALQYANQSSQTCNETKESIRTSFACASTCI